MAVDVTPQGNALEFGVPHVLFDLHTNINSTRNSYIPSRDGQRFLVNLLRDTADTPISVVMNWNEELKPRVLSNRDE